MAMQLETRALEREISDSDTEEKVEEIPEASGSQCKTKHKIIWERVAEFDKEEDAKLYLADSWKLLRTYRSKSGRKTCSLNCQPHGKPCLIQSKYQHFPGGKYLLYQSDDEHNESLGPRATGLSKAMKSKICEITTKANEALLRDDKPAKQRKLT